jgi:hypothetical protein
LSFHGRPSVVGKKAIEINSYHKIKNKQNSCMYEMMITLRGFTFVSGFVCQHFFGSFWGLGMNFVWIVVTKAHTTQKLHWASHWTFVTILYKVLSP